MTNCQIQNEIFEIPADRQEEAIKARQREVNIELAGQTRRADLERENPGRFVELV